MADFFHGTILVMTYISQIFHILSYMSKQNIIAIDNLSLHEFDNEAELIPLLTPEDEEEMANEQLPDSLPILPLRNTVLFPEW